MLASVCIVLVMVLATSHARFVCYQGSSLYQIETQECNNMDANYTGTWYCSKVTICEWGISSQRQCAETRGCSKEEECKDGSGNIYSGESTVLGGTRISTECCEAHKFDDDDAIAIDLGDICNSAPATKSSVTVLLSTLVLAGAVMIWG
mmetsp:Transcript_17950/g.33743  ORF Transcript_17950/g.33743 Transcript_17950/m.33743 type:complete len:149 (+) Transcript_17950:52-498(+)